MRHRQNSCDRKFLTSLMPGKCARSQISNGKLTPSATNSEKMDKWIFLKFWNLLSLIESWRKKLVSQMHFFVPSLTFFNEGVCQQLLVLFRVSRVHCHSTSAIDDFTCEPENIVSLNAEILGVCLYTSFVFYLKERLPPIIGVKMFSPPYFSRASLFSKADTKCSEATLRNCDQLQMGGMTLRSWASRQKTRKSWAISRASDPS